VEDMLALMEDSEMVENTTTMYTPANLMLNLIDGSNIEKEDVLYGEWRHVT
jgi:hypothetical protein